MADSRSQTDASDTDQPRPTDTTSEPADDVAAAHRRRDAKGREANDPSSPDASTSIDRRSCPAPWDRATVEGIDDRATANGDTREQMIARLIRIGLGVVPGDETSRKEVGDPPRG
jgi:hypothetical protein